MAYKKQLNPKRPWEDYMDSVKYPAKSYTEIVKRIELLSQSDLEFAALLSLLLLTGSRIREILSYTYSGTYKDEIVVIKKEGWKLRMLKVYKDDYNNQWLMINSRIEKQGSKLGADKIDIRNREKLLRKNEYKEIPICCEPSGNDDIDIDLKLVDILHKHFEIHNIYKYDIANILNSSSANIYINPFQEQFLEVEPFIDYSYRQVYNKMKKIIGLAPHGIRNIRVTYLEQTHKFSVRELMNVFGWKSPTTAMGYVRTDRKQIMKKMRGIVLERFK